LPAKRAARRKKRFERVRVLSNLQAQILPPHDSDPTSPPASVQLLRDLRGDCLDLGVALRCGRECQLSEVRPELPRLRDVRADGLFRDRLVNALALDACRLLRVPVAKAEQVDALLILAFAAPFLQVRVPDDVAEQRDARPLEILPVQRLGDFN